MTAKGSPGLTINQMVEMVSETNRANGWWEEKGEVLTPDHPVAQVAALSQITGAQARLIEAIRKPKTFNPDGSVQDLIDEVFRLGTNGIDGYARHLLLQLGEFDAPVHGSKAQALCRLELIGTELAEAAEAVLSGDMENLAEELADGPIRYADMVGFHNYTNPDMPIDLEATILQKNAKNRQRGYRHGGKTV